MRTMRILLSIALLMGIAGAMAWSQGIWDQAGDAPVAGGNGQAIVSTDSAVYVICQRCETTVTHFFRFFPGTASQEQLNTNGLPEGAFRTGSALVWDRDLHGYLYALLGARKPSEGDQDRRFFYRYDLDLNFWERLADTPFPQGDGGALVYTNFDNRPQLFALLGSNVDRPEDIGSDAKSVLAIYDLQARTWQTAELNATWVANGTSSGASLVWNGFDRLFALQGAVDEDTPLGRFASYSISTDQWLDLADIPEATDAQGECGVAAGASLGYLGQSGEDQVGLIYALGGGCLEGTPGKNSYRYDIASNRWENLTALPCPVGVYNGNRFFNYRNELYYWQGAPETSEYICGGDDIFRFVAPGVQ